MRQSNTLPYFRNDIIFFCLQKLFWLFQINVFNSFNFYLRLLSFFTAHLYQNSSFPSACFVRIFIHQSFVFLILRFQDWSLNWTTVYVLPNKLIIVRAINNFLKIKMYRPNNFISIIVLIHNFESQIFLDNWNLSRNPKLLIPFSWLIIFFANFDFCL